MDNKNLEGQLLDEIEMDGYQKIDRYNTHKIKRIADKYREVLRDIGEDAGRQGLLKTPERAAKALLYFTHGYDMNPTEILRSAMFKEEYSQMVIVKDIELYSLCEHHMVPFFGKAHIAYIPKGHIVGLSK
ncbi:MAG TPA: GTP cyclohydrolase I, partial [Anseongella sp.]|nr:GTP cyclohydrolase I [Anseongella sp.]